MQPKPKPTQDGQATPSTQDAEAAVVCGGVALAGSRRLLRAHRSEMWIAHAFQVAVGISCMVMAVVILCPLIVRVDNGKNQYVKAQNEWLTAFICITLQLALRPVTLVFFLLMPCASRKRLHIITKILTYLNLSLNITVFAHVMVWLVNEAGCGKPGIEPDMSCGEAENIGRAVAALQLGLQFLLDIWVVSILRRVSQLHRDPVTHEVLLEEHSWARKQAFFRWLLHENESRCTSCTRPFKQPEVNYDHKKVDIELSERQRRDSSVTTLDMRDKSEVAI